MVIDGLSCNKKLNTILASVAEFPRAAASVSPINPEMWSDCLFLSKAAIICDITFRGFEIELDGKACSIVFHSVFHRVRRPDNNGRNCEYGR